MPIVEWVEKAGAILIICVSNLRNSIDMRVQGNKSLLQL